MTELTNEEMIGSLQKELDKFMAMPGLMAKTVAVSIAREAVDRRKFKAWVDGCVAVAVTAYGQTTRGKK